MEIGNKIKFHRSRLNISQEEFAEKIFVSRQTVSNWENDKTYPDINSLVMISKIFDVSLDELIKGDVEKMKVEVERKSFFENEVKEYKRISLLYSLFLGLIMVIPFPLFYFSNKFGEITYGYIFYTVIVVIGLYYAFKVDKLNSKYDVKTYREILAFTEGKELSNDEKLMEKGKRNYQKIVMVLFVVGVTLIIFFAFNFLFNYI